MLGRQSRAQLEQGLSLPLYEFVEDPSSRGIRQGLEDVTHKHQYRQVVACLSGSMSYGLAAELRGALGESLRRVEVEVAVVGAEAARHQGGGGVAQPRRRGPVVTEREPA